MGTLGDDTVGGVSGIEEGATEGTSDAEAVAVEEGDQAPSPGPGVHQTVVDVVSGCHQPFEG